MYKLSMSNIFSTNNIKLSFFFKTIEYEGYDKI